MVKVKLAFIGKFGYLTKKLPFLQILCFMSHLHYFGIIIIDRFCIPFYFFFQIEISGKAIYKKIKYQVCYIDNNCGELHRIKLSI